MKDFATFYDHSMFLFVGRSTLVLVSFISRGHTFCSQRLVPFVFEEKA